MLRARYGVSPWIAAIPAPRRPAFPTFSTTATAPLVIVGGGLAGCMAAYACAAAGIKVILVEADRLGQGGSGRASGVFAGEGTASFLALEAKAGRRIARAHFDLTHRASLDLAATVKRLGIKAGLEIRESVRVVPRGWPTGKAFQKEIAARRAADLEAVWLKAAAVTALTAIESDGAAKLPVWGQCDPYRLVLGFAAAAGKRGARFFEQSPVMKITFDRKVATLHLAKGRIVADKVMLCTGEPTGLVKALQRHFSSDERYLVLSDPLPAAVRKQVGPRSTIVTDIEVPAHQIRWAEGERVLVAGADARRTTERAKDKVLPLRTGQLMYELTRLYPAISGVQPAFGWSVPMAHSADEGLYAGPHRNFPHQLFALGTAHDPARAFLASRILLRHVLGESTAEDEHFGFARNL